MKFRINKTDFIEALNTTQGVVEKKNVMPILANILIEAESGAPTLKISATDLEVAVHVQAPAQIEESGSITVSAKSLFDIVKESPSDTIDISSSASERLEINCSHSQYRILALPANEFPSLPQVEGEFLRLSSESVSSMFDKVCFAMSTDETRYYLNGVLIEKSDNGSVFVATDGHRLSFCEAESQWQGIGPSKIIVPRKGVNEWRRLLAHEKSFEISASEKHLFIRTEKQTLFIRLIDGSFPDYRRVIPSGNDVVIDVNRSDLLGALKRVSLVANDRSRGVLLKFSQNALQVSSSNPELGDAREDLAVLYKGSDLAIGFNARYMIDVLNVVEDDVVTLSFKNELSPTLVTCASNPRFRSVIMPMRM